MNPTRITMRWYSKDGGLVRRVPLIEKALYSMVRLSMRAGLVHRIIRGLSGVVSPRTAALLQLEAARAQVRNRREITPTTGKLHLGCGTRIVEGWFNVDLFESDCDVDILKHPWPWPTHSFDHVVSQHVIEHLDLDSEIFPFLSELRRVVRPAGEVWLTTPDMEKICRAYLESRCGTLIEGAQRRWMKDWPYPPSHYINHLFHQNGEHKNLFDFELLSWTAKKAGFASCERFIEKDLLSRFPEFPPRWDDEQTLVVRLRN
ncbi:MAG: methyltransferase domain-containing protein [Deltaproteobacteria bacterium]|nr:methyltransferase domain-containing protein [Deltaproteobacteria bacterium]MBI3295631.1 methyltransferase domain-containing protein [Deltaproteobacteria bacterium]